MTQELVVSILSDVFYTTFLIILPILGISLVVGIFISIFQAATSIQETTLTFVPKILITGIAIIILLPWMMDQMITITVKLINMFPAVIR
ncbi:MAG: flagellar biosynthetic protein FliQ [Ignavibacteria bacterium]